MISVGILRAVIFLATWGKWALSLSYLVAVLLKYAREESFRFSWKAIHIFFISGIFLWIAIVALGQELFWRASPLLRIFAIAPIPAAVHLIGFSSIFMPVRNLPYTYLAFTIFMKFLMPILWQLCTIGVIFIVLKYLRKVRPGIFSNEEGHVLLAALLLSGWPGILVVSPIFFIFLFLHILVNVVLRVDRTRLGFSALLALFLSFFGPYVVSFFPVLTRMFQT